MGVGLFVGVISRSDLAEASVLYSLLSKVRETTNPMKYLISFRDGDVDYDYASYDELEDARQAYERAIEELQDAQSVKLSDTTGDTIDSHCF